MAALEVQAEGSPVLLLNHSEFIRILRAFPLAETFPFRLMASMTEPAFELTPGGEHKFEAVRGAGVALKALRDDIGAREGYAYTIENLVIRMGDDGIKLLFPAQISVKTLTAVNHATGWRETPDVIKARFAQLREQGLKLYLVEKGRLEAEASREREAREEAARLERERQEELRRQQAEARAAALKQTSKAELELERQRASEHMREVQARAQATLEARASAFRQSGKPGGRKPKVRDKSSAV